MMMMVVVVVVMMMMMMMMVVVVMILMIGSPGGPSKRHGTPMCTGSSVDQSVISFMSRLMISLMKV
jgi:hypothetical protein